MLCHTIHSVSSLPSWIKTLFPSLSFFSEVVVKLSRHGNEKERFVEKASLDEIFCTRFWFHVGSEGFLLVVFPLTLAQYLNQCLLVLKGGGKLRTSLSTSITTAVKSSLPLFFSILPSPRAPLGNIRLKAVARHTCWNCLWGGLKGRNACDSWGQIALI